MSTLALVGIFLISATFVWLAGVHLSNATDALDRRYGWGDALGGLLLLSIATNLPELAITVSAGIHGNIGLATGNLLGGIAIQTVVLVLLDIFGPAKRPLTGQATSLTPVLEGTMVIAILSLVILGSQIPNTMIWRVEPVTVLIFVTWLASIFLVRSARTGFPWQLKDDDDDLSAVTGEDVTSKMQGGHALPVFIIAALVTLAGGVALEYSGDALATRFGMDGIVFGATVLAAATAIPEVATGLAAVRMGDIDLAISDIFGGNAFLPTLLLLLNVVSGQGVLSAVHASDVYLAALGCALTCVYIVGLLWRSPRLTLRMGLDSALVLGLYVAGIAGLVLLS